MINIRFDSSYFKAVGPVSREHMKVIHRACSYLAPGYQFTEAFKAKRWDGRKYLLTSHGADHGFTGPTGLLHTVVMNLRSLKYEVAVEDGRITPSERLGLTWTGPTPRGYQMDAVQAAMLSTRGIWKLATGSGKSLTTARLLCELGLPALVLVLGKEAVLDTYKELTECIHGCSIGMWHGAKKQPGYITVATIQSLYCTAVRKPAQELIDVYNNAQVLIADEAHCSSGANNGYNLVVESPAYYKIGQSGTPRREDGKDILLMAATGRVISEKNASSLQAEGYLSRSQVMFYDTERPDNVTLADMVRMEPADLYRDVIVENNRRNRLIAEIVGLHYAQPTVIIVKLKEHGDRLSQMLGIPFVSGDCSNAERERIRDGINDGSINQVIATSIFDQSVNFPRLEVLINAAGHSPQNRQTQRHGRILRNSEGKESATFIDFYDGWEARMERHSKKRIKHMEREGHKVERRHYGE